MTKINHEAIKALKREVERDPDYVIAFIQFAPTPASMKAYEKAVVKIAAEYNLTVLQLREMVILDVRDRVLMAGPPKGEA